MKYSTKWFLIVFLILIILFCSLGSIMQEGLIEGNTSKHKDKHHKDKHHKDKHHKDKHHKDKHHQDKHHRHPHDGRNDRWQDGSPYSGMEGLSGSQIPAGDKDQYILKSQIVPPVCPACPEPILSCKTAKCQPCPPCARCPEPAFDCKKVPNYRSTDDNYLPRPILNSFSQF